MVGGQLRQLVSPARRLSAGAAALGDAAHQRGLQFVLWFASLHVAKGTRLGAELSAVRPRRRGAAACGSWPTRRPGESLVNLLSDRADEWKFDVYREDFGTALPTEEGPDRTGVAEMQHIEGFYEFWSGLERRNPRLAIDNCSGGGRRIDIRDGARLAYTLWRSDFNDVGEGLKDQPIGR